ncbi:putative EF-hand domain-containing protein [Helianthus annuus]|nr:putative EF-hand domain-containing protein [Helianthus annuus]
MAVNTDKFKLYFKRADVDQDGRVSGSEAVSFFQASGLSKPVLAQDHEC